MKRVFIADDEKSIREGLKVILDWEALGFTICGESSNGEEAFHEILKEQPDLVLLDIRMPKMYGTDLIKNAREAGFQGKFIILSGYADFVYAQTAIKYGVEFYLTKPIDEDELLDAVTKIGQQMLEDESNSREKEHYKEKAKKVILHDLVTGLRDDSKPLDEKLVKDLDLFAGAYQVVIYERFNTESSGFGYDFAELLNVANHGDATFEHFVEDETEVVLLKGEFAINKFKNFLIHYEEKPPQSGSPLDSLFLAYGRIVDNLDEVYLSYEEAQSLLKRRFYCVQGQHTLGYEELPGTNESNAQISRDKLEQYVSDITDYFMLFSRKRIVEVLKNVEEYVYNTGSDISEVTLFLTDLFLQVKERIIYKFQKPNLPFTNNAEIIQRISECHYLYEIILFISEQIYAVMNEVDNSERDSILEDIIYYIDHNYQDNLKLEAIAPLFGYNSAYLGRIITKNLGESFNSYLDRKRIEKSMKLLSEQKLKVYEVSSRVGYSNVDYFHKKFKKYTGISPAEYRKNQ